MKFLAFLRTEPVVITGLVQSLLALGVGLGLSLTAGQTGAVEAASAALLALGAAIAVRPFPVAALTGAVTAVVTVLVAFGVPHISTGEVSSVNAVIVAVLSLVLRGHVTPTVTLAARRPAPLTAA
jgi:ABC-type branched-subunit amino acid transport system permease subunit